LFRAEFTLWRLEFEGGRRAGRCPGIMLCVVLAIAAGELDRLHERIAGRFARAEPWARVRAYVSGLAAGLERRNGWTLAEQAGELGPDGMQRLLRRADWDVDGVRYDVRGYVIERLGDENAVLITDETGFIKKGPGRRGCSGSTPGPLDGRRTARSACSWRTPRCTGTRWSTGNSTSLGPGPGPGPVPGGRHPR
jgi:hypothetical protein